MARDPKPTHTITHAPQWFTSGCVLEQIAPVPYTRGNPEAFGNLRMTTVLLKQHLVIRVPLSIRIPSWPYWTNCSIQIPHWMHPRDWMAANWGVLSRGTSDAWGICLSKVRPQAVPKTRADPRGHPIVPRVMYSSNSWPPIPEVHQWGVCELVYVRICKVTIRHSCKWIPAFFSK